MLDGFFHYTFLDGRLIGSEHPSARGSARERILSILPDPIAATLVTLTRQSVPELGIPGLTHHHLPMGDNASREQIAHAVQLVESDLARGRHVWVHCQKGIDRTGCVIGACMARAGIPTYQVIEMLIARFPENRRSPRMIELWWPNAEMIRSFSVCDHPIPGTPT